jgi:hypothetical protein
VIGRLSVLPGARGFPNIMKSILNFKNKIIQIVCELLSLNNKRIYFVTLRRVLFDIDMLFSNVKQGLFLKRNFLMPSF